MAVDGIGNVFVADSSDNAVKEIVAAGGYTTVNTLGEANGNFNYPTGVAVDGNGNVFVADSENSAVKEIVAAGGYTTVQTLGGGFSYPYDIAVDRNGNIFVADTNNGLVKEIAASCIAGANNASCVLILGSGFSSPFGLAVDGSGNLFVADASNNAVKEIVAAGGYTAVHTLGSGFSYPYGVAVDGSGNVFVADVSNNAVKELDYAIPPSLGFAATAPGQTSSDSPRTVTVINDGNANLAFSALSYPKDFPEAKGVGTDCTASSLVAAGTGCTLSIGFAPQLSSPSGTATALSESVGLTTNSLNAATAQSLGINGTVTAAPSARLTAPTPGTVLVGPKITFSWTHESGATGYQFRVGTTVGANNLYGSGIITATSVTLSNLPATSQTINVRLCTDYGAVQVYVDYTFTTAANQAELSSPVSGTILVGPTVTFAWIAAPGATGYQFRLGTAVGANDLYGSGVITATSATPTNLPTNGKTIYARLYTDFGATQIYADYTFTAATAATLIAPTAKAALNGPAVTFTWIAAPGATGYQLRLGTTAGANDLYGSGVITATSATTTNLPTNGETIYVRLCTNYGATQAWVDYTFTAATPSILISPTAKAALAGPAVTFTWTAAAGATGYQLWLGTTVGSKNLYSFGVITATSATPTSLPANGKAIYARLFTYYGSAGIYTDYVFTAATQAVITSPASNSALAFPSVTFTWTAAAGSTGYMFWLGTTVGANDLFNSGVTTATTVTLSNLPTDGESIYARLFTEFGASPAYADYTFTAAAQAMLSLPRASTVLAGPKVTFSWTAASGANLTGYSFCLGTSVGANNVYASGAITTTSATATNLPANGETIYARLTADYGSIGLYTDYVFTAATQAVLISPVPSSTFAGTTVTFHWTPATGANLTGYQFRLGSTPGAYDLYGSGVTTATSATVTNLPINSEIVYAQLMTNYGPLQQSISYTFKATFAKAQTITFPDPGTQMMGVPLTLSATASSGLPVSFTSTPSSVCTVSDTTATFIAGGTCTIYANQAGNSTYGPAQASIAVVVNKATPIVSVWPAAGPITYGQTLAYSVISAGAASVPGTFAWTTPNSVPPAGTDSESFTFTPAKTAAYTVVTVSLPIVVTPSATPKHIQHIVVIMQENRSFNNLFMGFPGADTATSGMYQGTAVPLQPVPFNQGTDLYHGHPTWYTQWDHGAMDAFQDPVGSPILHLPYSYVPQSQTALYWTLAQNYTLADRMFQSNTGPSFVAHQYMIAGQSAGADENPLPSTSAWGCDAPSSTTIALIGPNGTDLPGVYPCFDYPTVADRLDDAGISWRYYAPAVTQYPVSVGSGVWSAFQAIKHIRFGPDWTNNVISPNTKVFADIANGQLAQVTWIVPAYSYSDHAAGTGIRGPDWVTDIVNEIGASPFWDSTAIFITWDDWGGWYDPVAPPQIDNMGFGFRVPLIIVSPYAKTGYVSHNTHEFSSFLKYTEETFGLPSLGTRDVYADDFSDCFDYTQTPQPYVQIPVTQPPSFFVNLNDSQAPDDD